MENNDNIISEEKDLDIQDVNPEDEATNSEESFVDEGIALAQTSVSNTAVAVKRRTPVWVIIVAAVLVLGALSILIVSLIPKYDDYTVTVVDNFGKPLSRVTVKFIDKDGNVKTRITENDGTATYAEALCTDYNIVLEAGYSDAVIDDRSFVLTKDIHSLKIVLRNSGNTTDIYGGSIQNAYASFINTGTFSNLPISQGLTSYYLFSPSVSGIYKVSVTSAESGVKIAYLGDPNFVQDGHIADGYYDGKSFEFTAKVSGGLCVFGITSPVSTTATLVVERVDDAPFDPIYDAEWEDVHANEDFKEFKTNNLVPLDLTNPSLSVEKRSDGYYYTADGKMVYIKITQDTKYLVALLNIIGLKYVNGEFQETSLSGVNFGAYVYEDGEFVTKYLYNEMIKEYALHCDSNGAYPLTEELANAIKLHGNSDNSGWFDYDSPTYIFVESKNVGMEVEYQKIPIPEANRWLFLCYVEQ